MMVHVLLWILVFVSALFAWALAQLAAEKPQERVGYNTGAFVFLVLLALAARYA